MMWSDLAPDSGIVSALDHAGPRDEGRDRNSKKRWSEMFADACAVAVADKIRRSSLKGKRILPKDLASGTEPLTPLGSIAKKRIDVTVADPLMGLEIGLSLKGLNFRDGSSKNFDKNLTGRLYELGDEVRLVHEHLPHAFMVGLIFLPLAAAEDKVTGPSSFANAVVKLRDRSGRLDSALQAHAPRCDMGFVALYSNGDEGLGIKRGVCRVLSVETSPPRRGRPQVDSTVSIEGMVGELISRVTREGSLDWAVPESDI